jgi:thiamine-phosphate pyrophosphorylase
MSRHQVSQTERLPAIAVIREFYAVLDRDDETLARQLISDTGGANVLQLRIKPVGQSRTLNRPLLEIALMARAVTKECSVSLIINDDVMLALAVGADGVHLGQQDMPVWQARSLIAAHFVGVAQTLWIGVSTHNEAQVRKAIADGADYIGYGPIFTTKTKIDPEPTVGLEGLQHIAAIASSAGIPVVAIGGITVADVGAVYDAGADAICAISAVNNAADVEDAARAMSKNRR